MQDAMRWIPFTARTASDLNLDFLENREHFIPFRVDVLLERMLQEEQFDEERRRHFRSLKRLLADRFHYEFREVLEDVKNDFIPFDPDRETLCEPTHTEDELHEIRLRLYTGIRQLLRIGNYLELTSEQLLECLKLQPIGGLSVHVDTDDFDEFHVYYRGIRHRTETSRFLFFWDHSRPVTSLNRVFVVARFKRECGGQIMIKMFKDVAVENIKIIAPKVKLGMPFFDRIKIGGTVLGSLATTVYKLVVAVTLSPILFAIVLGGLLLAAFKGIMSFLNSRTKYLHVFSSSLYYRNLSNNKAALTTLVDAAEEQEVKETLLGYFTLLMAGREMTLEEIDETAEKWIEERFGHRLDFEVDDAVRKLWEKELLVTAREESDPDEPGKGRMLFRSRGIKDALQRLDKAWDGYNTFNFD